MSVVKRFEFHKTATEALLKQAHDMYLEGRHHEVQSLAALASVHVMLAFTEWTDS